MTDILLYTLTRLVMAVGVLVSVDTLAETSLAGGFWNVLAAATLIVIFEIMLWDPDA